MNKKQNHKQLAQRIYIVVALVLFLMVSATQLSAIIITPSGTYYIGDILTFRASSTTFASAYNTTWNFGDGATTTRTSGLDSVTHAYKDAGIYTVTVVGQFTSVPTITETINVIIERKPENRTIQVSPMPPVVGQVATFTAFNFNTPGNIRWDMGDGTIKSTHSQEKTLGTSVVTHTYSQPGTYRVRAYDFNGLSTLPISLTITVNLPVRSITYTPAQPKVGVPVTFNAVNFLSQSVDWNFGDGSTTGGIGINITHVYNNAGTFTVTAKERDSNFPTVSVTLTVTQPSRQIGFSPRSPRVDQTVSFQAQGFVTAAIDWNFGDGTVLSGSTTAITHRFATAGSFTVSAKDSTIQHTPITTKVTVLPENRFITVTPPEARTNENITVTAMNFRGQLILWDFGDGEQKSGGKTEVHQYRRPGTFTISARDENGASQVQITTPVTIQGIDDQVTLQIAEVRLDNGKYYKVVPKNSKHIQAVLRMKMRGTGLISGYWIVDGHPYEFFNELVKQGEVKEIYTRRIPGLPVTDAGLHTITVKLTRPAEIPVTFPVLKYFVLTYENILEVVTPQDGFIAKEDAIPSFSWKEPKGASKYQVAFSNYLYPLLSENDGVIWNDVDTPLTFTPGPNTWQTITRNEWTYWKVRALDTFNNVVAESDVQDIKVVIATAKIAIQKVTDLNGNVLALEDANSISTRADDLLVQGSIQYMGDSEFLVLQVYIDDQLTDQLLFRDIKKEEIRYFETSITNKKQQSKVQFQVLKVSSPAVMVGIKGLLLNR